MQFIAEYSIKPGTAAVMEAYKEAHLTYRMNLPALRLAAQIHSDSREMIGSILFIDANDRAEAERIARADPYIAAGIYTDVVVRPCEVRFCNLSAGPPQHRPN